MKVSFNKVEVKVANDDGSTVIRDEHPIGTERKNGLNKRLKSSHVDLTHGLAKLNTIVRRMFEKCAEKTIGGVSIKNYREKSSDNRLIKLCENCDKGNAEEISRVFLIVFKHWIMGWTAADTFKYLFHLTKEVEPAETMRAVFAIVADFPLYHAYPKYNHIRYLVDNIDLLIISGNHKKIHALLEAHCSDLVIIPCLKLTDEWLNSEFIVDGVQYHPMTAFRYNENFIASYNLVIEHSATLLRRHGLRYAVETYSGAVDYTKGMQKVIDDDQLVLYSFKHTDRFWPEEVYRLFISGLYL